VARAKLAELDGTIARLESARDALAAAVDCACAGSADRCTLVARTQQRKADEIRTRPAAIRRRARRAG
jgi:hypothetical protein